LYVSQQLIQEKVMAAVKKQSDLAAKTAAEKNAKRVRNARNNVSMSFTKILN
jgi:hypothetical protein